ncbi:MAG: Rrf2 family transcriptional regulator [Candidatus Aureabacteria bacterium]|nr:Rrf2 family transcriptional regulator [Candidatus Auribacterota bacterium]
MAKLIKISEASALALHAMALMAGRPDLPLSTREAASRLKVSEAHLSKVLQRLARNGLVKSLRGPRGGFILRRSCATITLLNIYEAIEGKCEPSGCLLGVPSCGALHCIFGSVIEKLDGDMRGYLSRTRLSDISGLLKREPVREKKNNRN